MENQLKQALSNIQAQFSDKRTQFCEVTAILMDGSVQLQGTVLDRATATAVQQQLQSRFPDQLVDMSNVTLLVGEDNERLAVSTTLTSLYNKPGWLSEPASQLNNGQAVTLLKTEGAWAFVQQMDGYLGWVYRYYLSTPPAASPTHLLCEPVAALHLAPTADAPLISRLLGGTAVTATQAQNGWICLDLVGDLTGWLPSHTLRPLPLPTLPEAQLRQRLIADAHAFTGVPYLWGGSSAYGLDCSGFAQLVYKLSGIALPRDADFQFANGRFGKLNNVERFRAGRSVEPPFKPSDLLFFSSPSGHRRISHVGISLGGWQLIHASRSHNGVYVDDVQTVVHLRETFAGARTFIGESN
jgi:cell wall-associated NlpC family hydrolase